MSARRIESTTSRTAESTCMYRAVSSLETNRHYRSDEGTKLAETWDVSTAHTAL